jgi:DNA repair protein RecO (recombination protein O)
VAGPTQRTRAVLLRSIDYGDSDRIVTLLTRELGKLSVLARGARRSRHRFPGALEPYCIIDAEVGEGRGELGRLVEATVTESFPALLRDLAKMQLAGAALRTVRDQVPPRAPDARIFDMVVRMLSVLDGADGAGEPLLLAFQLRLLALSGLAPGLDVCAVTGRRAPPGQAVLFDPERGSIVSRTVGGAPLFVSGSAREKMKHAMGGSFDTTPDLTGEELSEARRLVAAFVERHVGRRREGSG